MASTQVLNSSASSFSYTNTTGKNVRVIFSYVECAARAAGNYSLSFTVGGVRICSSRVENGGGRCTFGKNLSAGAYSLGAVSNPTAIAFNNGCLDNNGDLAPVSLATFSVPHELYVANGSTLTITTDVNFVTISVNGLAVTES